MGVPTLQQACVASICSAIRSFYYGKSFDRTKPLPPCPLPLSILPLDALQPITKTLLDEGLLNAQVFASMLAEGIERVNISYFAGVLDDTYITKLVEVCSGTLQSLTANGCVRIASYLPRFVAFHKLTRLHVSGAGKTYPYTQDLGNLIKSLPLLENLNVSGWHLEDEAVDAIADCGSRLVALNISHCGNITIDNLRRIARNCQSIGAWNICHIAPLKKVSFSLLTSPPRPLFYIKAIGIEMSMFPEEFSELARDEPSVSAWSVEINLKNVLVVESLTSFAPREGGELLRTLCLRSVSVIPDAFGDSLSESCPNLEYLELIKTGIQHIALSCPNLSVLNLEASVIGDLVLELPKLQFLELSRAAFSRPTSGSKRALKLDTPQLRWLQMMESSTTVVEVLASVKSPMPKLEVMKLYTQYAFDADAQVARLLTNLNCVNLKHLFLSSLVDYDPTLGPLTVAALANLNPMDLLSLVLDIDFLANAQSFLHLARIAQVATKLKTFGAANIGALPFAQSVKFSTETPTLVESWADGQLIMIPSFLSNRINQIFKPI